MFTMTRSGAFGRSHMLSKITWQTAETSQNLSPWIIFQAVKYVLFANVTRRLEQAHASVVWMWAAGWLQSRCDSHFGLTRSLSYKKLRLYIPTNKANSNVDQWKIAGNFLMESLLKQQLTFKKGSYTMATRRSLDRNQALLIIFLIFLHFFGCGPMPSSIVFDFQFGVSAVQWFLLPARLNPPKREGFFFGRPD